jgi:hypothetical protein
VNDRNGTHASAELIGRYVSGDPAITAEAEWALEAHLEACSSCRARVSELTTDHAPDVAAMVTGAWEAMAPTLAESRPAPARRVRAWLMTWASPAMIPWIVSAVMVATLATLFGRMVAGPPNGDSVLFLLAPLVPVFGVAAAWSTGLDPMYELAVATPRAGLYLVLRRTLAVLVLVIPLMAVASLLVGTSPVLWLLPSLVCTLTALALGSVIGVEGAAMGITGLWLLIFTPQVVIDGRPPVLLGEWTVPMWAGIGTAAAVVLVLRAAAFTRISHQHKTF